jgi:riboflavin kinase/FMN adenylyltransferase
MQTIHLDIHSQLTDKSEVLALGFFDGMHRAHVALLKETIRLAKQEGYSPSIMTFSTHVLSFIKKQPFSHLTSLSDKQAVAATLGFETFYVLQVSDEMVKMAPQTFIEQFLNKMKAIVVGFDFTYGRFGAGNVELLEHQSAFRTVVIEERILYKSKIGSTRIREALKQGKMGLASHLLGHPYAISGTVIHGRGRGQTLGFPTANIDYDGYLLPIAGVHWAFVIVDDVKHCALVNIGDNPTFGDDSVSLEAYLLDFRGDLYGKPLTILFRRFQRPEIAYSNIDDLVQQMKEDERLARAYFQKEASQ